MRRAFLPEPTALVKAGRLARNSKKGGKDKHQTATCNERSSKGGAAGPHASWLFGLLALGWEPRRVLQQSVLCSEMEEGRGAKK